MAGASLTKEAAARLGAWLDDRPWLGPVWAAAGTIAGAVLLAHPTPARVVAMVLLTIVLTLPPACLAWWRRLSRRLDDDAVATTFLVTKDALGTLAKLVSSFALSGGRDDVLLGQVQTQVVGSCILTFPDDLHVRSCLFLVTEQGDRMVCVAKAGRDQPTGEFVRGTPRGDRAFALLEGTDPVFVPDMGRGTPDTWSGSGHGYAGFVTVPIFTSSGAFGMLTVDTPHAGALTDATLPYVQLVADMAAIAFAVRVRDPDGGAMHTGDEE